MASDRYAPIDGKERVFRTVDRPSGFLPAGAQKPNPSFLAPTKTDKDEAERTGRRPGLSAWRVAHTTVDHAHAIRDYDRQVRDAGRIAAEPSLSVRDPLTSAKRDRSTQSPKATEADEAAPMEKQPTAFAFEVAAVRATAKDHARDVDIVADPRTDISLPGAGGHALIEGLKRPMGGKRQKQNALLFALTQLMTEHA